MQIPKSYAWLAAEPAPWAESSMNRVLCFGAKMKALFHGEALAGFVATASILQGAWRPYVDVISDFAADVASILGAVYLVMRIIKFSLDWWNGRNTSTDE